MKLSSKKISEIYGAVHDDITCLRVQLAKDFVIGNAVDYKIAQLEIPLVKRIIKIIDPKAVLN